MCVLFRRKACQNTSLVFLLLLFLFICSCFGLTRFKTQVQCGLHLHFSDDLWNLFIDGGCLDIFTVVTWHQLALLSMALIWSISSLRLQSLNETFRNTYHSDMFTFFHILPTFFSPEYWESKLGQHFYLYPQLTIFWNMVSKFWLTLNILELW